MVLAQSGNEKTFTIEDLGPNVQVSFRCACLLGPGEEASQRVKAQGIAKLVQQGLADGLVLLLAQCAGGVNQHTAGLEGMEGALQQAGLYRRDLLDALQAPVAQGILVFAHRPFAGAGGIEQNGVEGLRQPLAKYLGIEMGHAHIGDAAALDIGTQYFEPTAGVLIGNQHPLVVHQRSDLGGLGAWSGGGIEQHAVGFDLVTGKERRHRQHGTRFLDIEETAQMFRRVAKRNGFIGPGQPETCVTPGHCIELPAKGGHFGHKVRHGDLQGIDPDTAPQWPPTAGYELLHGEVSRHDGRDMT